MASSSCKTCPWKAARRAGRRAGWARSGDHSSLSDPRGQTTRRRAKGLLHAQLGHRNTVLHTTRALASRAPLRTDDPPQSLPHPAGLPLPLALALPMPHAHLANPLLDVLPLGRLLARVLDRLRVRLLVDRRVGEGRARRAVERGELAVDRARDAERTARDLFFFFFFFLWRARGRGDIRGVSSSGGGGRERATRHDWCRGFLDEVVGRRSEEHAVRALSPSSAPRTTILEEPPRRGPSPTHPLRRVNPRLPTSTSVGSR